LLLAEQLQREAIDALIERKHSGREINEEQLDIKVKMLSKFFSAFDEQVLY
jgi:hypothetical protein